MGGGGATQELEKLCYMDKLLSSACDAVGHAGSADKAVWVDDDTALLPGVVDDETAPIIIIISIHLHHVTRTHIHVQPENTYNHTKA